jgi:hypothetical protein
MLNNIAQSVLTSSIANVSGISAGNVQFVSFHALPMLIVGSTSSESVWSKLISIYDNVNYYMTGQKSFTEFGKFYEISSTVSVSVLMKDFPQYNYNTTALYQSLTKNFNTSVTNGKFIQVLRHMSQSGSSRTFTRATSSNILFITPANEQSFPTSMPTYFDRQNTVPMSYIVGRILALMIGLLFLFLLLSLLLSCKQRRQKKKKHNSNDRTSVSPSDANRNPMNVELVSNRTG